MLNRFRDFWGNVKRIFFLIVMLLGIALLTVVLISPDSLKQFIENISIIVRILFLLALYGAFGFYAYRVLNGRHKERGLTGLISRVGGNITAIEVKIAKDTIDKAITEVQGVKSVEVDLTERRGEAVIRLSIVVGQDVTNILQKQNEIRRRLDHVVRKQLGVSYAQDPIIALKSQSKDQPQPSVVPTSTETTQPPAVSVSTEATQPPVQSHPQPAPTPAPVVDATDDDSPEWQMIVKASQQPSADDDKKDES